MPACLVTGAGNRAGIARTVALLLADDGWDIGLTDLHGGGTLHATAADIRSKGVRAEVAEADLADPAGVASMFGPLAESLGGFQAVVAAHCRDVELSLVDTTVEEFDRHFAVNARSVAQLIQAFARDLRGDDGRFVAFTSDAVVGNVPYGVSKGALDRIILAAARELGSRGIRANCINPGPTETGWITEEIRVELVSRTPLGRVGQPSDAASLVRFLLSPAGAWITGQVLHSNGGFR